MDNFWQYQHSWMGLDLSLVSLTQIISTFTLQMFN
jgi:hypothetical protein